MTAPSTRTSKVSRSNQAPQIDVPILKKGHHEMVDILGTVGRLGPQQAPALQLRQTALPPKALKDGLASHTMKACLEQKVTIVKPSQFYNSGTIDPAYSIKPRCLGY